MKETKTPVADFTTYQKNRQKHFTSGLKSVNFLNALTKSNAEPRNSSNYSAMANNSTPSLNRAFFVRGIYTPKERQDTPRSTERLSMVVRNGKGLPFAVFIAGRFSSPLRTTAQSLETLAVVPKKLLKGLSAMLYKFLLLGDKRLTVRIRANSEYEARQILNLSPNALCIARLKGGVYA
ncbi:ash family protein [Muribacter muris]|uniref:ash family protein n=1 Tax=Muribacter muris TaxID=67855 RepID=UPI00069D04A8|nr:ash family protein [Muribacter muris]